MKPVGLATFLVSMLMLGTTLLWFPDMYDICEALLPVGTPVWLSDAMAFLPFLVLSLLLLIMVIRLTKRGRPKDFEGE
jgi:membrane protein implicated in regulation of membrane protease activity